MSTIRLKMTMKKAPKSTIPWISRQVGLRRSPSTISLPIPGMLKTVSVRIALPASSTPTSRPSRVTIGVIALRSAVAHDHPPLGQALGARGADVVLRHHVDHLRAQVAGVDRRRRRGEHDPRQQHRADLAEEGVGLAVAADAGEDRDHADVLGEQVERHQPEPEDRRRDEGQGRDHRRAVEQRALPDRGDDPDRDRDREPEDHRAGDEEDRRRQAVEDDRP